VTVPTIPPGDATPPKPPPPTRTMWDLGAWRIEKRLRVGWVTEGLALILAVLIAIGLSALLIVISEADVGEAYKALLEGAFGSRRSTFESLVQATPLIFTGLAAAIAFRARIWNIGGEGQFFAGAMGGWWVANAWGDSLPQLVILLISVLAAALAGAVWASIAGVLKARFDTNEIITTVMLNFVIGFILSYLLGGPWRSPDTFYFQTERMPEASWLPRFIEESRLHWGFALAIIVAIATYILIWKTPLGFEIRGLGINQQAAKFKGISVAATTVIVMALSGAVAGLAGMSEVAGLHHRLQLDISIGYGFTGIIIALIGRLHPAGVVAAAIAFGALINGATFMQITTGTPSALIQVIQGMVLVLVLIAAVFVRYRIRRINADD